MSRPEGVPENVWAIAPMLWGYEARIGIARAIMAAEERCAKVAEHGSGEGTFGTSRGLEYLAGYVDGRKAAAAAIRKATL
jgi:hypothetical protein